MKTIFNTSTSADLQRRIAALSPNTAPLWGKMNAVQMVVHCTKSEEMYLCDTQYDRLFIGKLFGKMALKGMLKDEKPTKPNQPTHKLFKGDALKMDSGFEGQKQKWISLIEEYGKRPKENYQGFSHPFFGPMTHEQIGQAAYKHIDHHLRQFGL